MRKLRSLKTVVYVTQVSYNTVLIIYTKNLCSLKTVNTCDISIENPLLLIYEKRWTLQAVIYVT